MTACPPTADLASTGAFLLLPSDDQQAIATSADLLMITDAARGAQKALAASTAYRDAIHAVAKKIPMPHATVQGRIEASERLVNALQRALPHGWVESPSCLSGKKTKSPIWYQLVKLSDKKDRTLSALIYMGIEILLALHHKQRIPHRVSRHLDEMATQEPLTDTQIDCILDGLMPDDAVGSGWVHALQHDWRNLLRHYSGAATPPPTKRGRIAGQILNTAIGGTTAHKAGASSHRQLSHRQTKQAITFTKEEIAEDTLTGALCFFVMTTGFSVDLVAELDLLNGVQTHDWTVALCVQSGMLKIDCGIAVNGPAKPLPGCEPSSYIRWIALPSNLQANLAKRLAQYPEAKTLIDLYPGQKAPGHTNPIYPCSDDIQPTWSRLRQSLAVMLRHGGTNSLHVFLLTGDMGHIPRSKLHYASVSSAELWEQFSTMYQQCQWDAPVAICGDLVGFECRVVPTIQTLRKHDQMLLEQIEKSRPGNHCGVDLLYAHHNAFIHHAGWRLAMLLALRESVAIDLPATIGEKDLWLPCHDKLTPNDRGAQPVPLAQFTQTTIAAIKAHCAAVWKRLQDTEASRNEFALWCKAVSQSGDVRLLGLVTDIGKVVPLATNHFVISLDRDYKLPPDVGRKALENLLRKDGLPSSYIDAVLRHVTSGQVRLSSVSNASMHSWLIRTRASINKIAVELFAQVTHGISKG